jgi:hypothetical protein
VGGKVTLLVRQKPLEPSVQEVSSQSPLTADEENEGVPAENGTISITNQMGEGDFPQDAQLVDDENPSVNLHEFLVQQLQEPKDRVFLLKLEEQLMSYVQDNTNNGCLHLPRYSSYHRMLAHRVAAYFGLIHNVDPFEKTSVVVSKGPHTRIPDSRFIDHIPVDANEQEEKKSILKRSKEEVNGKVCTVRTCVGGPWRRCVGVSV